MNIFELNQTLQWLERAHLEFVQNESTILLEFFNATGGPGENVDTFARFSYVCLLQMPTIIEFHNFPQLESMDKEAAISLIPNEYDLHQEEFGPDGLSLIRLIDGFSPLPYFVLSYEYTLWQSPVSWVHTTP